jgi:hypothetical protein
MAIALPVENGVANLAFVIEESTMLLALIAVTPIFDPVTAPSTILFALIAVRPSFGPVTLHWQYLRLLLFHLQWNRR